MGTFQAPTLYDRASGRPVAGVAVTVTSWPDGDPVTTDPAVIGTDRYGRPRTFTVDGVAFVQVAAGSAEPQVVESLEHRASASGGASSLAGLSDVDTTGASEGDVLTREGGAWVAAAPGGGGVPIFPTLSEAQAYEAANPGSTAYYVTVDDGLTHIVATPPTFTDLSGTANDTYTIPALTGAIYKVGGSTVPAGTYPGSGTVTVTAEAESGYALDGTTSWSHTFSSGISVTPAAPTADDELDRIYIPSITGVDYQISGATVTGVYLVGNIAGDVTVTAVAQSGYTLTGATSWTFTFTTGAVDLPSGAVAVWDPADLPAVDATTATWASTDAGHTLTHSTGTGTVQAGPNPGTKYLNANGYSLGNTNFATPLAVSATTDGMAIGVMFRYPTQATIDATSSPGAFDIAGANGAGLNIAQSTGPKHRVKAHGSYTTDDAADLLWHRAVIVWEPTGTSPMLRFYLDGALVHTEASTTQIGLTTELRMPAQKSGTHVDIAAAVVYDRSLNETEAINLTGHLAVLAGFKA